MPLHTELTILLRPIDSMFNHCGPFNENDTGIRDYCTLRIANLLTAQMFCGGKAL